MLNDLGQSVWLDFIERGLLREGRLAQLVRDDAVTGVTSNPAIFNKAIGADASYQGAIAGLARAGLEAHEIYEALMIEDIRAAADVLSGVYRDSDGRDGYVSLEVSPHLARDAEGTYWEAQRLWALVERPNLMIKVPGTLPGIAAIRRLCADGINVNVTLLFGVERYAAVLDAFVEGLTERCARGQSLAPVASVASFFLSRIDTLLDPELDAAGTADAKALRGECAIACARAAYSHYQETIASPRWGQLQARGARPQRLLWASTGTKDPGYSDVKYVDALAYPDTVTTLPLETLAAYRDHGRPAVPAIATQSSDRAMSELAQRLRAAGIDWNASARELEEQGILKFIQPHEATLATLREQLGKAQRQQQTPARPGESRS